MKNVINGYKLSRAWFDFCFANPELINPNHTAIFTFAIEHSNRLGWKEKFGFPSQLTMDAIGIKNHHTFIKYFNDLVEWGFFKLVQRSKNQYSANIISIQCGKSDTNKALDKAFIIHAAKQLKDQVQSNQQSTPQSNDSIDKPINQLTNKPITTSTSVDESLDFEILELIRSLKSRCLNRIVKDYKLTAKRKRQILERKKEFDKLWPGRDFKKACLYAFKYKADEWFGTDMFQYFEPETLLSEKFTSYLEKAESDNGEPYIGKGKPKEEKIVYRITQDSVNG